MIINLFGLGDVTEGQGQYASIIAAKLSTGATVRRLNVSLPFSAGAYTRDLDIFVVGGDWCSATGHLFLSAWGDAAGKVPVIVIPFWELPVLPTGTVPMLSQVDKVLAPSGFIDRLLAGLPNVSRLPLAIADEAQRVRSPHQEFTVMYSWSVNSSRVRKNPDALISAWFSRELGRQKDCKLVLLHDDISLANQIAHNAGLFPNVLSIRRGVTRDVVMQIYADVDVYVAPFRSEGLGLCPIEALSQGTPVIITDGSGACEELTNASAGSGAVDFLRLGGEIPVSCQQYSAYLGWLTVAARWRNPSIEEIGHKLVQMKERGGSPYAGGRQVWEKLHKQWQDFELLKLITS